MDSVPAGTRGRHPAPAVAHGGPARRGRRCPGPGRGRAGAPVRRTGIGSGASACSCPQPKLVWQDPVWTTLLSITNRTMTCNFPMPASLRSARSRSSSWLTTSSSWACSSNDARGFGLRDTCRIHRRAWGRGVYGVSGRLLPVARAPPVRRRATRRPKSDNLLAFPPRRPLWDERRCGTAGECSNVSGATIRELPEPPVARDDGARPRFCCRGDALPPN